MKKYGIPCMWGRGDKVMMCLFDCNQVHIFKQSLIGSGFIVYYLLITKNLLIPLHFIFTLAAMPLEASRIAEACGEVDPILL